MKNQIYEATRQQQKIMLFFLLLTCSLYYLLFAFCIAMPQMGWWQYYGWRIVKGDIPYVDFYLYLPPYHVLYCGFLYKIFRNNIAFYTLYGLLINKMPMWILMYSLLLRKIKPLYSAISVFAGMALNSVYSMDLTYDYNPLVSLLFVFIVYLLIKSVDSISVRKSQAIWMLFAGLLCGMLLMTKQNIGLATPAMIVFFAVLCFWNNRQYHFVNNIIVALCGFIIGIMPGIIYLLYHHAFRECLRCINSAMEAKGVGNGFLITTFRNAWRPNYLAIAFLILAFYYIIHEIHHPNYTRAILFALGAIALGVDYSIYTTPLWNFLNSNSVPELSVILIGYLLLSVFFVVFIKKSHIALRYQDKILFVFFWITLTGGLFFGTRLTVAERNFLYHTLDMFELRRGVIYIIAYLEIFIWLRYTKIIFIDKRTPYNFPYYIGFTGVLIYLAISFTSAPLEELYAVVFVPFFVAELFNVKISYNRIKTWGGILLCLICGFLCFVEKITIPYEWHSWRVPPLYDKDNPMVASSISGLKGIFLPKSDEEKYEKIVSSIEEYSDTNDIVYQFPNVMLFNVLTERKTIYNAIPYFDVCPDDEARSSVEQLISEPPEMVVWSNLNENRWVAHENQYRNGNRSGQRDIQDWFDSYVKENYRCLGQYDNNEGEDDFISIWHRTAFSGGNGEEIRDFDPKHAFIFQLLHFSKNSFRKYVFKMFADEDGLIDQQLIKITLRDDKDKIINKVEKKLKKAEDGYYYVETDKPVRVNVGVGYTCEIEFRYLGYTIHMYRSSDGTATPLSYSYINDNHYNYSICMYCE